MIPFLLSLLVVVVLYARHVWRVDQQIRRDQELAWRLRQDDH